MVKNIKAENLVKIKKKSKGIALVEVIAALGIAVVVLTSLVSLSLYTLRSTLDTKLQLQATKVAAREAELVRTFRDTSDDWEGFINNIRVCYGSTTCCINAVTMVLITGTCTDGVSPENTTRYFTAANSSGGQLGLTDGIARITITARWTVGGVNKYTHIYTDLTNWNKSD